MFKGIAFIAMLALLAWVFVGFLGLAMWGCAIFTAIAGGIVCVVAAEHLCDQLTYWDCMR